MGKPRAGNGEARVKAARCFLWHDHQPGSLRPHGLPPVKRAKFRRAELQRESAMVRVQRAAEVRRRVDRREILRLCKDITPNRPGRRENTLRKDVLKTRQHRIAFRPGDFAAPLSLAAGRLHLQPVQRRDRRQAALFLNERHHLRRVRFAQVELQQSSLLAGRTHPSSGGLPAKFLTQPMRVTHRR